MITELEWKGPQDNDAARAFFAQHARGIKSLSDTVTPGVAPKYEGDAGLPGGLPILVVITGDGATRYCTPTIRWVYDGQRFEAERIQGVVA